MRTHLIDTALMLGLLGIYATVSIALSVTAVAAYMKWMECRGK